MNRRDWLTVDNALLLSLSNQMVARRTMEVISNNIANMNTTGFKRESPVFEEHIVHVDVQKEIGHRKEPLSFVRDALAVHDMSNGELTTTGNKFDVAIEGEGYFTVSTPDGPRYTRNGKFGLDDTGRLVTTDGHPVLDDGGAEIVFSNEESEITIARDGTISSEEGVRNRLGVVSFANPQTLKTVGNSLWETDEAPIPVDGNVVAQGMLEQSNVQPVVEMVRMIETMRSYQASTELLNAGEDLTRRAVQKLGERV
ncbi:Flagellar basal-body rod protein FlgG [Alphaproteobacteria bacterium SO-S41]|nr:Flagellar basal-body rod protein FlgG [Alphaproteobacteria bacterium SO-S41]